MHRIKRSMSSKIVPAKYQSYLVECVLANDPNLDEFYRKVCWKMIDAYYKGFLRQLSFITKPLLYKIRREAVSYTQLLSTVVTYC